MCMTRWEGKGIAEVGINTANEDVVVRVNERLYQARGLSNKQIGDSTKARTVLGWETQKTFKVSRLIKSKFWKLTRVGCGQRDDFSRFEARIDGFGCPSVGIERMISLIATKLRIQVLVSEMTESFLLFAIDFSVDLTADRRIPMPNSCFTSRAVARSCGDVALHLAMSSR
jgi:hypothetical protein